MPLIMRMHTAGFSGLFTSGSSPCPDTTASQPIKMLCLVYMTIPECIVNDITFCLKTGAAILLFCPKMNMTMHPRFHGWLSTIWLGQ